MGTQNLNWPPGPSPMNMVSKTNTPVLILPNKKAKMITVLSPVNTVLPFLMAEPKLFLILLTMNMDMLPMLDTKVRSFLPRTCRSRLQTPPQARSLPPSSRSLPRTQTHSQACPIPPSTRLQACPIPPSTSLQARPIPPSTCLQARSRLPQTRSSLPPSSRSLPPCSLSRISDPCSNPQKNNLSCAIKFLLSTILPKYINLLSNILVIGLAKDAKVSINRLIDYGYCCLQFWLWPKKKIKNQNSSSLCDDGKKFFKI